MYKVYRGRAKSDCVQTVGVASCLSVTRGTIFYRQLQCREHAVCLLSGIEKHPLAGGYLYTIVLSIGAMDD